MATVIDQFIVKYTLDTKDLDKGATATKKKLEDLKREGKDTGTSLGDSVEAGAKRATGALGVFGSMLGKGGLVGVALGSLIYAGKVVDDKMFKVAQSLRRLGIDSKNFGIAAAGMRNLQNASEMAGGSMEDATQTVSDLSKSLFNLKFNGQVSESLVMLSRLGVQFQDSYGRARDFNDVMLDTATAIENAKKAGRMTDAEAFQFATQAGFSGGMAQIVTSGRAGAEREMAAQQARRQVQGQDIAGGTRWVRSSLNIGQTAVAEAGNAAMSGYGNTRADVNDAIVSSGRAVIDALKNFDVSVERAARRVDELSEKMARVGQLGGKGAVNGTIDRGNAGAAPYMSAIKMASLRYGIPEEVITGLLRTESGFNPNAVNSKTGAAGIAQIMPEMGKVLGVTPGANANADIDAATQYLAHLRDKGLKQGLDPNSALVYGVDAYHTGEGNIRRHQNIGPESMSYAGNVLRGTAFENTARPWMGGGSSSSVQIDNININTQATDARGIAGSIQGELSNRKLLAAHAETGMN